MAQRHESALRQHRRNQRAAATNKRNVSRVKSALRALRTLIAEKKKDETGKALAPTLALIDHSVARKALHRNAAARLKSRLTRHAAALAKA